MKKIILPLVFLSLFLAFFLPRFFIKVKINCKSQVGECPAAVTDQISPLTGKTMFSARKEIEKKLESNFMVSAYSIQFKLPNILRVDLIVKNPVFALKSVPNPKVFALIGEDGNVLTLSDKTTLPTVAVNDNLPGVGEKVSDKMLTALRLLGGVYKMYQNGSGTIEADTLLVDLKGGVRVIFPLVDADRELLLGSLRLIYSNIQEGDGQSYSQIDLRYKNPVLR